MALSIRPSPLASDAYYEVKKFKVGLDYGTTYTAGAFCLSSNESATCLEAGKIYPFINYRRSGSSGTKDQPSTEISSEIRYEDGCTRIGAEVENVVDNHGNRVPGHCVSRAKLGLDDRNETRDARCMMEEALRQLPEPKTAEDVIADYLTELFKFWKRELARRAGYDERDSIELNCTVPAMWTQRARRKMVKAVEIAGQRSGFRFEKVVRLWPEPEAATAYVMDKFPNLRLKVSNSFPNREYQRNLWSI
jgi:molecular chaperone DnaK (HSP70)